MTFKFFYIKGLFGVAIEGLLTQAEVAPPPLLLTSQGTASSGMTEFESQPVKGNKHSFLFFFSFP